MRDLLAHGGGEIDRAAAELVAIEGDRHVSGTACRPGRNAWKAHVRDGGAERDGLRGREREEVSLRSIHVEHVAIGIGAAARLAAEADIDASGRSEVAVARVREEGRLRMRHGGQRREQQREEDAVADAIGLPDRHLIASPQRRAATQRH